MVTRLLRELAPDREGSGLKPMAERSEELKRVMQDTYDLVILLLEPREVRRILVGQYEVRYEIRASTIIMLRLWYTREDR